MDASIDAVMIPLPFFLLGQPAGYLTVAIRLDNTAVIRMVIGVSQQGHSRSVTLVEVHQTVNIHIENKITVDEKEIISNCAFEIE